MSSHLGYRIGQPVSDRYSFQVYPIRILQNVVSKGGDVLPGVALAGEVNGSGFKPGLLVEKPGEGGEEVLGDFGLVPGDVGGGGGDAEARADGVVEEEEAEEAVPGAGVGLEGEGLIGGFEEVDAPGAELEEVADHGGAAGAALEPDEEWGLGEGEGGGLGLVEGVEDGGGIGVGGHRKVTGFGGAGCGWEERGAGAGGGGGGEGGEKDEEKEEC
ncbi:hypothetical protein TIFTF001_007980 [Ficus carica]|uniref:Uncharacterized protein n=1 Tax=Ficus carica TaxID=3494 RepID=A0AA88DGR8_FICCA|nr:hypothetical protein TIFTF001_007980 [Ficus carica]